MSFPALFDVILDLNPAGIVLIVFCVCELAVVLFAVVALAYDEGRCAERKLWADPDAEDRERLMRERLVGIAR